MPKLNWNHLQFSLLTFGAAMLALYLAMSIDLQQPYWAMMTVYIVSQPLAAAVRSKAIHRLLGTLLGATAAVVMVPRLVNTPALLCLAMALWVGGCLTVSLLDRSPRSYIMMLSGYTAAIIGFTSVNNPGNIFNLAVARTEEIVLGIVCATLIHSLWFPRPIGHALRARIETWLGEADRWALDILHGKDPAAMNRDRSRLATAASEIHIMATHLPFDTSHLRETTAVVRALHDRILLLIPTLSSLADRLSALRSEQTELDATSRRLLNRVSNWITAGAPTTDAVVLNAELAVLSSSLDHLDWYALNRLGLVTRLQDLVLALAESRALLTHLHDPLGGVPPDLEKIVTSASARPLHKDLGLALLSGCAATLAILITCLVWISTGWAEGGISAMLTAILCCLFAAMDDPTPAIKVFGISLLIAFPLAGFYLFVVFPSIGSFPLLVLALAPTLLSIGLITLNPRYAAPAMVTLLNFCNSMAIQERVSTDFASFININLSQFFGLFTAIFVIRSMRSMSADASTRRLLVQTWQHLARLTRGRNEEEPAAFASRMVDRLGLLTPRLAASQEADLTGIDALRELRVGMDMVALQSMRSELPPGAQELVERLLGALGEHYQARSSGSTGNDDRLLSILDQTLRTLSTPLPARGAHALAALVGLRRNLFPAARFSPCSTGGSTP